MSGRDDDEMFDPILGYLGDPRGQHPAGRGEPSRFRINRRAPEGIEYYPTYEDWLHYGILRQFCSQTVCGEHDPYGAEWNTPEYLDGPCLVTVRLYPIGGECGDRR